MAFIIKNKENIKLALNIRKNYNEFLQKDGSETIRTSWEWINFVFPIVGCTFASFGSMFKEFGPKSLGVLFIDEAGQAVPQACIGAIIRTKRVLAVGDPYQVKPVVTLNEKMLDEIRKKHNVSETFVSKDASVQTLIDRISPYGYLNEKDWIGVPLWVHRRCNDPLFSISNEVSYNNKMV